MNYDYQWYTLQQLVNIKYGKSQKKVQDDNEGQYPIYGTGGVIGYAKEFLYNKPSVLIGRKGSISKVKYVEYPFWTVDTLFYTEVNNELVIPKYLYYKMSSIDFNYYNEGTTIPSLRTDTLNKIELQIPSLEYQKLVLKLLSPLDEKIEINCKINDNLEELAQTLFKRWFVEFEFPNEEGKPYKSSGGEMVESELGMIPKGWRVEKIGNVTSIIRGASPRPIQEYISEVGMSWIKISDATSSMTKYISKTNEFIKAEGVQKSRRIEPETLILSNSATPGVPMISLIEACVHDGWLIFNDYNGISKEFLYYYLNENREKILALSNGSVFRNLKTDILKSYNIIIPNEKLLSKTTEMFIKYNDLIKKNVYEINSLIEIRQNLLPKLMYGEIDVSKLK